MTYLNSSMKKNGQIICPNCGRAMQKRYSLFHLAVCIFLFPLGLISLLVPFYYCSNCGKWVRQ